MDFHRPQQTQKFQKSMAVLERALKSAMRGELSTPGLPKVGEWHLCYRLKTSLIKNF
jgi:hypothetical protein